MKLSPLFLSVSLAFVSIISLALVEKEELIPDAELLFPLGIGNTWNYTDLANSEDECYWTEEIVNISKSNSITTAEIEQTGCINIDYSISINEKNEICIYGGCIFKTGIAVGTTYEDDIDGFPITIKTKKENISVPAGDFEVYTYSFQAFEGEIQISFSPTIGLVRNRAVTQRNGIEEDISLIDYSLK